MRCINIDERWLILAVNSAIGIIPAAATAPVRLSWNSPGHNSIVQAPDGSLYIVYHRHADPNCQKPNWTRVVCIDKLYFDKDGKLKVDGPTNSAQHISW